MFDVARTEFEKAEVEAARWLEIGAWHHGYPQPDEIGKMQKAAFQMKREPKWGRNSVLQLIWVYDELFVEPDVWLRVFEPRGIGCRPVTNRKGAELKTVVQLVSASSQRSPGFQPRPSQGRGNGSGAEDRPTGA